uniref:Dual specificity protein phosphatase n=2 Tax=environmental samples TaxID=651140 RepID=A0A075HL72_9ARCH|nr:dual specificity protein phosphatase [uncultured marine thaumarchaeote KM3_168_C06]AIF16619.1 dual specificity protein phosphatase [uncultured marine thaumarchaeote KM3_74_F11]
MTIYGDIWRKVHGTITGRPDRFSWLIENKLAGSGIPTSIDEVEWAIKQGVKSIITIREEPLDDDWVKDVKYLHIVSNDMGTPEFDDLARAVDFIHKRITNNEPVLVHCLAGMGRTGLILACYLIKYQKMSASEATEKVREERPGSIQSYPQEEIIFRFEKSLQR